MEQYVIQENITQMTGLNVSHNSSRFGNSKPSYNQFKGNQNQAFGRYSSYGSRGRVRGRRRARGRGIQC